MLLLFGEDIWKSWPAAVRVGGLLATARRGFWLFLRGLPLPPPLAAMGPLEMSSRKEGHSVLQSSVKLTPSSCGISRAGETDAQAMVVCCMQLPATAPLPWKLLFHRESAHSAVLGWCLVAKLL